jgi:hypothetical protein
MHSPVAQAKAESTLLIQDSSEANKQQMTKGIHFLKRGNTTKATTCMQAQLWCKRAINQSHTLDLHLMYLDLCN